MVDKSLSLRKDRLLSLREGSGCNLNPSAFRFQIGMFDDY